MRETDNYKVIYGMSYQEPSEKLKKLEDLNKTGWYLVGIEPHGAYVFKNKTDTVINTDDSRS